MPMDTHWSKTLPLSHSSSCLKIAKRHMKSCSTSLIIREMQIKTTMRYHLTPVRMGIIRKSTNHKCRRGCGEKGTLLHCWWECKLIQPLWRTVWRFRNKLKIELPYDPAIPLLGIYPEKTRIWNAPRCSLQQYYNSQDMEATRKSIKRCVAKEELVHVQMEY